MTYTVRKVELTAEMVQTLYALDRRTFPGDAPVTFQGTYWWLAEDADGAAVGFAGLAHAYEGRGFLHRVGVLPEHRGNGLQKRLIRARERGGRGLGMVRLITYTSRTNSASLNSLVSCGYRFYNPYPSSSFVHLYRDL